MAYISARRPLSSLCLLPAFSVAFLSGCSDDSGKGDVNEGAGVAVQVDPDYVAPSLMGAVSFSVPSGTFEGELSVGMSGEGEIHYTTDGGVPDVTSPAWSGEPLVLTETTQLRAVVISAGAVVGEATTALYIRRTFDVSSDVPLIIMEGYGAGKPDNKEDWWDLGLMVFEPSSGTTSLSAAPSLATRAGYHRRGQSSMNFPKTPYRVELWGNTDVDLDYQMLGMPAESDWAFVGPCTDRSLVRNAFVYSLGSEMGLLAMQLRFAEVYINQDGGPLEASDYEGIYAVTQSVKNQKSRVNLKQLGSDDSLLPAISGGYIFKFDQAAIDDGETEIPCVGGGAQGGGMFGGGGGGGCWDDLELVDPSPANSQQLDWIAGHIQQFHDLLHAEPLGDYMSMMDVGSFVDHFIINEITRDVDAYIRSHFMHKDREGLITAGPIWDYNFALGNVGDDLEGWQWEEGRDGSNDWHRIIGPDPAFQAQLTQRYQALRGGILSDAQLMARIDKVSSPLVNAAPRDLVRWPVGECSFGGFGGGGFGGGQEPEPNPAQDGAGDTSAGAAAWQGEVGDLKEWVTQRMAWLDSQWR